LNGAGVDEAWSLSGPRDSAGMDYLDHVLFMKKPPLKVAWIEEID
jgi:hypothetical protein